MGGFEITPNGVRLSLVNGRTAFGDVFVGADGVASAVRRCLHPDEPAPRASGYCALRGVAYGAVEYLGGLSGVAYLVPIFGQG